MKSKLTRCYLHIAVIHPPPKDGRYDHTGFQYIAQLIARGTGADLFRSKLCDTREQATTLAKKHLEKNKKELVLT
jgi:hypothetical protein